MSNLSEEEIINVITKMIEKNDDIFEETGNHLYFSKMTAEAIQGLLNLYKQEKEKNKELEQRINKAIAFINNDDVYFTDGESWENVLYIESVLKGE